ncbi:MAG: class I SAM-dependent methyltransferase [Candidatus Nitrosocosmicus sp.]
MASSRWTSAQHSEKKYWHARKEWINDDDRNKKFWEEMIWEGYVLNYDFFKDKRVLEIGCGPAGIIFSINNAKELVGLEPLDVTHLLKDSWKKSVIRNGSGENIPYSDKSFDAILCFNVLDHTINPSKVLNEIYRVLDENGEFLLWNHVLKQRYKFLTHILNKLDSPHPHHLTAFDILNFIDPIGFKLIYKKIFGGLGPIAHSKLGPEVNTLKFKFARIMMNDIWLRLKKVEYE